MKTVSKTDNLIVVVGHPITTEKINTSVLDECEVAAKEARTNDIQPVFVCVSGHAYESKLQNVLRSRMAKYSGIVTGCNSDVIPSTLDSPEILEVMMPFVTQQKNIITVAGFSVEAWYIYLFELMRVRMLASNPLEMICGYTASEREIEGFWNLHEGAVGDYAAYDVVAIESLISPECETSLHLNEKLLGYWQGAFPSDAFPEMLKLPKSKAEAVERVNRILPIISR